jgi:glycosyltransferase involved in cell wall biosynthesis
VVPGIGEDDFVMIWNGVILDWYDLDVLLRAVHRLKERHPHLRLFFMGTEHPGSRGTRPLEGLGGGVTRRAMALCEELGILGTHVVFNDGWASGAETEQFLLESDMAVCTYFDSLETRHSLRVRYADVFWAGLPLVCTEGDVVAEWVRERSLGVAVPPRDLDALTNAIDRLVRDARFRRKCAANMSRLRKEFAWERTLAPLIALCRNPARPRRYRERDAAARRRTLEWLTSRAYYEARFGMKRRAATFRKRMVGRYITGDEA